MTYVKDVFGRDLFKDFDKVFVGFDDAYNRLAKIHDDVTKNIPNYPPYNIRKVADNMNPIPVWGDGTELRDLLYIDDFVEAIQMIIEKQETYDVYNVGSNQVYSVNEVLGTMKQLVDNTNPIEYVSGKPSMIPVRKIDSTKIERNLGWKATTTLQEGLKKAYDWYLENKDEFQ